MEGTVDIYVNQGLAPKKRTKKKEAPEGAQRFREEDDPDYENISVIARNQNGSVEQRSTSIQRAPGASAPSNSSGLCLVHKSIVCLYLLLALCFLLCIILLSLVVVKSSDFSEKLMSMNNELWNVSSILQKEQDNTQELEAKIIRIKTVSDTCDEMVKQIKAELSKKSQMLNLLNTQVKKLEMAQKAGSNSTGSTS